MTVAFVQKSTQLYADNATSIAPSLTGCTAGNHTQMEVGIANGDTTSPANAVGTPTGGWSVAIAPVGPTGAGQYKPAAAIFYQENIAGGTQSGTITMVTGSYARANITEHSGVALSGSLDVTASSVNTGSTSGSSGTTATTANADSIAVCTGTAENGTSVTNFSSPASTGWTVIDTTVDNSFHVAGDQSRKILSATGTQSGSWTWTTSAPFAGVIAVFKGATSTPVVAAPLTLPYPLRARGERTGRGGIITLALFPPAHPSVPAVAVVSALAGEAQAASQAAGGVIDVSAGAGQGAAQASGSVVDVTAGQAQAAAQAAGAVVESVAGSAQSAGQASASVSESVAGAGQAASQAVANLVDVTAGSAQAAGQASGAVVEVVKGEAGMAGQAAGVGSTGTTVLAAGEAQAASQGAGAVSLSVASSSAAASQAAAGAVELVAGASASPSQAAGSAVVVASGAAQSASQAEGTGTTGTSVIVAGISAGASQAAGVGASTANAAGFPGFEVVQGRPRAPRRLPEVSHEPILERMLRAKAQKVKPAKERAARRAKTIEMETAALVLDGATERAVRAKMAEWSAQRPVIPAALDAVPTLDVFLAQVRFRVDQARAEREKLDAQANESRRKRQDEDALTAILLA